MPGVRPENRVFHGGFLVGQGAGAAVAEDRSELGALHCLPIEINVLEADEEEP